MTAPPPFRRVEFVCEGCKEPAVSIHQRKNTKAPRFCDRCKFDRGRASFEKHRQFARKKT